MVDLYSGYRQHFQTLNPMSAEDFAHGVELYQRVYGQFLPRDRLAPVLDLGCGGGHFLYFVRVMGYSNHLGVERDSELADLVKRRVTALVREEDIFSFVKSQPSETWSVIALNDVIEHLSRESAVMLLQQVGRILKPDGRVFIKTINMSHPLGLRSRYMDLTHEAGYTEESLAQLLTIVRLRLVHLGADSPEWANTLLRVSLFPIYRHHGRTIPRVVSANLVAVASK